MWFGLSAEIVKGSIPVLAELLTFINFIIMSKKGGKKKGGDDGEREEEEKVMVLEHKCRAL